MKKILSFILALCAAASQTAALAYENTIAVPEGTVIEDKNAKFLLDDDGSQSALTSTHNLIAPSGWDIDRRGGVFKNLRTAYSIMTDTSDKYPVSASYRFDSQKSGKFTFETFLYFNNCEDGFYVSFADTKENAPVKLYIKEGSWYAGNKRLAECEENVDQRIRLIIDMDRKSYFFALNGKVIDEALPFEDDVESIDVLKISTSYENEADLNIGMTSIYKNYLIQDRFLTAPIGAISYDWEIESLSDNAVSIQDPMKTGVADTNALNINDTSAADRVILTRSFEAETEKLCVQFNTLLENHPQNISFALKSKDNDVIEIVTKNKEFYIGDNAVKSYSDKIWNKIRIEADPATQTAVVKVNGKVVSEQLFAVKADSIDAFEVTTSVQGKSEIWIDDVEAFAMYEYDDYPTIDEADMVGRDDEYLLGMHQCNLWMNGWGRGWDVLSTYDEQKPYLGYYDEGKPELVDWELKYMLEHGIDFIIPCFYSPGNYKSGPIKQFGTPNAQLIDAFMNAKYSKYMKFALNYCATMGESIEDFIEYGLEYLCEYFYSDERYMTIDNKPLIFYWVPQDLATQFGGVEGAKRATDAMREAVKKIGYDDAIIIAGCNFAEDPALQSYKDYGFDYGFFYSVVGTEGYKIGMQQSFLDGYKGGKGKLLDTIGVMSIGTNSRAWNIDAANNPWVNKEDYKTQLKWLKDEYMPSFAEDSIASKIMTFDNWNELSEGHAIQPAGFNGFSCLDSIREVFCGDSSEHEDLIPNEVQKERIRGRYPKDRKVLRYIKPVGNQDIPKKVGHSWNFSNKEDADAWKITKQIENLRWEDEVLKGTASGADGGIVTKDTLDINVDYITYVKIRIKSSGTEYGLEMNGNTSQIFFTTQENPNYTERQSAQTMLVDADFVDLYFPVYKNIYWNGTLTGLRFDPFVGTGSFEIESIEFLETDKRKAKLYIDDEEFALLKSPVNIDGTMFFGLDSVYDFWSELNLFAQYYHGDRTFTLTDGKKKLVFTQDSDKAYLDGQEIQLSGPVFYEDGLLMAPIRVVAESFGVKVEWDSENYAVKLFKPQEAAVEAEEPPVRIPYEYEFSVNGDTEGWSTNSQISKSKVKDGIWNLKASNTDPIVSLTGIAIPANQYKTLTFRMKNGTTGNITQLYFATSSSGGYDAVKCINVNVETMSDEFVEYEVDLTANPEWKGTITGLRFDPVPAVGSFEIDYIRFTE